MIILEDEIVFGGESGHLNRIRPNLGRENRVFFVTVPLLSNHLL